MTESVLERRALEHDTAELRQRYRTAQDTVLALQRSLLPGRLPVLPGFRVAARYLVAAAEQAAGGDWFDIVPIGGKIVAVVGDVVGARRGRVRRDGPRSSSRCWRPPPTPSSAYPGPGGRVRVEGTVDGDGRAYLTVSDTGRWRPAGPDPGLRGRGLLMMRGAMDSVEIERGDEGTTVLLDRLLSHPPVLGPGASESRPGRTAAQGELTVRIDRSDEPRIVLAGPIDINTVARLRAELWSASRGGALPLTVDVTGVNHLASAGITLLFEFVEEMATGGREARLIAPPDCPARIAMTISGLEHIAPIDAA